MNRGEYLYGRRVRELENGFEYKPGSFVAGKNQNGCLLEYKSQDGTVKRRKRPDTSIDQWLNINETLPCVVDFVPDKCRDLWTQLQKLGKCSLEYGPKTNRWIVRFYENAELERFELPYATQADAITEAVWAISYEDTISNGTRWFNVKDPTDFKKISDKEAEKRLKEIKEANANV